MTHNALDSSLYRVGRIVQATGRENQIDVARVLCEFGRDRVIACLLIFL